MSAKEKQRKQSFLNAEDEYLKPDIREITIPRQAKEKKAIVTSSPICYCD